MKIDRRRAVAAGKIAGAVLALTAVFYFRQFKAVITLSPDAGSHFHPTNALNFGFFFARTARDMQNQTKGAQGYLYPQIREQLLFGAHWDRPVNLNPASDVRYASYEAKADLTAGATLSFTVRDARLVERPGAGMAAAARPAAPSEFAPALSALALGHDLFCFLYRSKDGQTIAPSHKVAKATYLTQRVFLPSALRQSSAFAARAFRNYALFGGHQVYIYADPTKENVPVLVELSKELDAESFKAVDLNTRTTLNCLSVLADAKRKGAKIVRAATCRGRVTLELKAGRIAALEEEFVEEPMSVKTWACDERRRCVQKDSSTVISAVSLRKI